LIKQKLREILHEFWNSNMATHELLNKMDHAFGGSNTQAIFLYLLSKFDPDTINRYQYAVALLLCDGHPAAREYVAVFEKEHL
jgi:hypothetical protein